MIQRAVTCPGQENFAHHRIENWILDLETWSGKLESRTTHPLQGYVWYFILLTIDKIPLQKKRSKVMVSKSCWNVLIFHYVTLCELSVTYLKLCYIWIYKLILTSSKPGGGAVVWWRTPHFGDTVPNRQSFCRHCWFDSHPHHFQEPQCFRQSQFSATLLAAKSCGSITPFEMSLLIAIIHSFHFPQLPVLIAAFRNVGFPVLP